MFPFRFMMGKEMGIVAVVDSLSVLRQHSMWRQNGSEWELPRRPEKFGLGGECPPLLVTLPVKQRPQIL